MRKISDILRQTREKKGLSLEDIENSTKIKKVYIKAIEEGKFHKLPSESYALGFVKNYAKFLELPINEVVPLFRREYNSKYNVHIVPNFRKTQHKFNRKIFFNSKTFLLGIAVLIVIVYVFFQYSSLLFAPQLSIEKPVNGSTVAGNVVEVSGKTDPYATVTIDGEEVFVNLQGTFKKSLYVFSGDDKIEVTAKNRFGKQQIKTLNIKVK